MTVPDPTPEIARQLERICLLARRGHSAEEVARRMGLTYFRVTKLTARYRLREECLLMTTGELAAALGMSSDGLKRLVRREGLPHGQWFHLTAFSPEQVVAIRERVAPRTPSDALEGWLSARQVARELGMSCSAFSKHRREGHPLFSQIEARRMSGQGNLWRYNPADVRRVVALREAPPSPRELRRRGYLPLKQVAEMAGRSIDAVHLWHRAGAPHVRTKQGRVWLHPQELLAWLDARPGSGLAEPAQHLRAALEPQEAAA